MVPTRFAVAIHILLLLACGQRDRPATSQLIAESVNTNPVVVRRITGLLARAGLVRVRRGPGGAELTRAAAEITLADVWVAMNVGQGGRAAGPMLPLHACPNVECPIGGRVHAVLGEAFAGVEAAILEALRRKTLAGLVTGVGG